MRYAWDRLFEGGGSVEGEVAAEYESIAAIEVDSERDSDKFERQ